MRVAGLVNETGGRPRRSARFRDQLAPDGFADELRFAFVDAFGRWGSMGLFHEARYSDADQAAAAQLVPLVSAARREGVTFAAAEPAAPAVLVLDGADRVARATPGLTSCSPAAPRPARSRGRSTSSPRAPGPRAHPRTDACCPPTAAGSRSMRAR